MATPFLYLKKPKMVLLPEKRIELQSVSPWEHQMYLDGHTPFCIKEKPKIVLLPENEWSYRPKTVACRHNLVVLITWGGSHLATPLSLCVRLKISKMIFTLVLSLQHISSKQTLVTAA